MNSLSHPTTPQFACFCNGWFLNGCFFSRSRRSDSRSFFHSMPSYANSGAHRSWNREKHEGREIGKSQQSLTSPSTNAPANQTEVRQAERLNEPFQSRISESPSKEFSLLNRRSVGETKSVTKWKRSNIQSASRLVREVPATEQLPNLTPNQIQTELMRISLSVDWAASVWLLIDS